MIHTQASVNFLDRGEGSAKAFFHGCERGVLESVVDYGKDSWSNVTRVAVGAEYGVIEQSPHVLGGRPMSLLFYFVCG